MSKIAIITDSTCNIPANLVKKYHIYVIPQHLIWGTEDLLDLEDISASQFYDRLISDPVHPKSSQPPASEFATLFARVKKDGASQIFIPTLSSELSGTYASAVQAAGEAGVPIRVYDSRSVAMGLGWQVIAAAHAREAGADLDQMVTAADAVRRNTMIVLTVDTLDYLYKGGRIGGAAHWIGTALDLKPQMIIDPVGGVVVPGKRVRTRSKAVEAVYQEFFARMDTNKPMHVAVHHAKVPAECEALADRVRADYPGAEVIANEITPVIGTHAGPGALALCGYYEERALP